LKEQYGFQSVDVIKLNPDHPEKAAFRQKFWLNISTMILKCAFFVEGRGLFYLHVEDNVYAVLCEQGDLISVPATPRTGLIWVKIPSLPVFVCLPSPMAG